MADAQQKYPKTLQLESLETLTALKTSKNVPGAGIIVHYGAPWCEPVEPLREYYEQLAAQRPDLTFVYCDADAHGDIAEAEEITSVPHVVFFRPNLTTGVCDRTAEVSGAKMALLSMNLNCIFNTLDDRSKYPDLDAYCKYLINKAPVMVFITGTPSRPKCGFTGRLMEMFFEHYEGLTYSFYDVMVDDEVCEHLKKYSDWPTYPQIYVNGELIGGMDIAKQMHEKGTLAKALGYTAPPKAAAAAA